MCNRYQLDEKETELIERFEVQLTLFHPEHGLEIAKTDVAPIIRVEDGKTVLDGARWGFIPAFAKDLKTAIQANNARADKLLEPNSMFNRAFQHRRCIIPATEYYEWLHEGKLKHKHGFTLKDNKLFGCAGIWGRWRQDDGSWLTHYAMITTEGNDLTRPIHDKDRMPVILQSREDEQEWLHTPSEQAAQLIHLLQPYPSAKMAVRFIPKPGQAKAGTTAPPADVRELPSLFSQ